MITDHTPPETCIGCGAGKQPKFVVAGFPPHQSYTCSSAYFYEYGAWKPCLAAFAWAAQHRPLVAELVAALEWALRHVSQPTVIGMDEYAMKLRQKQRDELAQAQATLRKVQGSTP